MKCTLAVFLCAIIAIAFAEPLAYRQRTVVRTSARQTDNNGVALQAEFGDSTTEANAEKDDEEPAPAPVAPQNPVIRTGPYNPTGWRPLGQLLVVPFAVRENLDSTAAVETKFFNNNGDSETTDETATDATNNQQKSEVETSEPKSKKTGAYKKPPQKLVGELNVKSKDAPKSGTAKSKETTDQSTTETGDATGTTETAKSEDLETTSEPESEAVDDSQQSTNTQQNRPDLAAPQFPQTAYFIQLPDGSLQRIVYVPQQTPTQAAFVPQPASGNIQYQQLNQSPSYPFGFNPIVNPKIVTFSSQYHAF